MVLINELDVCGVCQVLFSNVGTKDKALCAGIFPIDSSCVLTRRKPALNLSPCKLFLKVTWFIGCDVVVCSPGKYILFCHCKTEDSDGNKLPWWITRFIVKGRWISELPLCGCGSKSGSLKHFVRIRKLSINETAHWLGSLVRAQAIRPFRKTYHMTFPTT